MCFDLNKGVTEASIAKKDIVVFKGLDRGSTWNRLRSPYQGTPYTIGKTKAAALKRKDVWMSINIGLHSCKSYRSARSHAPYVFRAIIPKGSYYYENRIEYVSNKLRVVGEVTKSGILIKPTDGKRKKKVAVK